LTQLSREVINQKAITEVFSRIRDLPDPPRAKVNTVLTMLVCTC
jgi:hypothetical protein